MKKPYQVFVERDTLAGRAATLVLLVSIAVIGICAAVVWLWLPGRRLASAGGLSGAPDRVGMLEVTPLSEARKGQRDREEQRAALERYLWVERERGIVAIPIRRAIELSVERQR